MNNKKDKNIILFTVSIFIIPLLSSFLVIVLEYHVMNSCIVIIIYKRNIKIIPDYPNISQWNN